jgi:hypothetical protein
MVEAPMRVRALHDDSVKVSQDGVVAAQAWPQQQFSVKNAISDCICSKRAW